MNIKTFINANTFLGNGAIEYLFNIEEKRIAIVMGGKSQNFVIEKLIDNLKKVDKETKIVGNIKTEPCMKDIVEPLEKIKEFEPDCILAIGGGSVMDLAKALWIFYEYPDLKWEDIIFPKPVPKLGNKARLIAVPTTSGTGSETTSCLVIVDETLQEKKLVINQNIVPSLSILDTDLVYTMPKTIAANSGMDAFTHALEAATSKGNNPMVQRIALISILDIFEYLTNSVNGEPDTDEFKEARERVHIASYLAGVAINNVGTGLAHTFDQIGPKLNIPHGLTCAILLPATVRFIGEHPFYTELATMLGYNEGNVGEFLAEKIVELNKSIGIPESFRKMGIEEKIYIEVMEEAVNIALESGGLQFAPRVPDYEEGKKFMLEAYYGL